jgi:tRNA (guanine-N7-)-methyltransferase
MSKGKLAKFADLARYPHVFEQPFSPAETAPFPMKGRWGASFFGNDRPIVLELGCGRGEYTVELARLFPQKNFIGIDIKGARIWSGATRALNERLANVAFLRTHIELIDRFFDSGEVSEIWITFPDPQMKKATKRLVSTYFLQRYRGFLAAGGLIHLKTDSNFLYTYTRLLLEANELPAEVLTEDLYRSTAADEILRIQTYYEQQWLARGLAIKYIRFRLPGEGTLHEPEAEIALDDYRSYGRTKRSELLAHA